jgi:transposase-like protein
MERSTFDAGVRELILKRMSPPNRESVAQIARDTGIHPRTLYGWRQLWQRQGQIVPASSKPSEKWSAADKFAVVLQSAALTSNELGAFCRERGLYPQQVARWRQIAEDANKPTAPSMQDHKELQRRHQEDQKQIRQLQKDLRKKEKALAEAAALLMISKKCRGLWPEDEEN